MKKINNDLRSLVKSENKNKIQWQTAKKINNLKDYNFVTIFENHKYFDKIIATTAIVQHKTSKIYSGGFFPMVAINNNYKNIESFLECMNEYCKLQCCDCFPLHCVFLLNKKKVYLDHIKIEFKSNLKPYTKHDNLSLDYKQYKQYNIDLKKTEYMTFELCINIFATLAFSPLEKDYYWCNLTRMVKQIFPKKDIDGLIRLFASHEWSQEAERQYRKNQGGW